MVQEAILPVQVALPPQRLPAVQVGGGTNDFLKVSTRHGDAATGIFQRQNPTAMALDSIACLIGRTHFPSKWPYEGQGRQRASKKTLSHMLLAWHPH